ncbi:hypothetical protein M1L60_15600 [Actinoplanes sp. TRM 88003]|uniref:Uncharacterized protein n=1 Tax=Paractinoplanes aksuensis TaxID=2939490 RepID=A0ABT1DMF6_9ACTN|nr:hypothetical protein [Actinoplanes aksuensis]MCO8272018.1 hypothetical protein [Actinoplanes aksuensis]
MLESMQMLIGIAEGGADAERLDYLIHGVRSELLQLDVDAVEPVSAGPPPPGALLVSLGGSAESLTQMMTALRSWVGRTPAPRTIEMTVGERTLRISDSSIGQQTIDEFVTAVREG